MNSSNNSTSFVFASTAAEELLPVYVEYKAENLCNTLTENGPRGARYNRSRSGWFDNVCILDWFQTTALPFCRRKSPRCVLIGTT